MIDAFRPSIVLTRGGRRIAIIGVTMSHMPQVARTGRLRFADEAAAVRAEAERVHAQGVDIIVVLSHCGIEVDRHIALHGGPHIDVIVGGHSHTFMYTRPPASGDSGDSAVPNGEWPRYDYPMVVRQETGTLHQVLIVHAASFTRWVGDLTVHFDAAGRAVRWSGRPVFQAAAIAGDAGTEAELRPWRELVAAEGGRTLGVSRVPFVRDECFRRECNLGNLMADAAVDAYRRQPLPEGSTGWTRAAVAVMNVGATRVALPLGAIRVRDLQTAMPFENTWDRVELRGVHVLEMLEHAVSRSWSAAEFVGPWMLHFAGKRRAGSAVQVRS